MKTVQILVPFWAIRLAARYPGRIFATQGGVDYMPGRRWQ